MKNVAFAFLLSIVAATAQDQMEDVSGLFKYGTLFPKMGVMTNYFDVTGPIKSYGAELEMDFVSDEEDDG